MLLNPTYINRVDIQKRAMNVFDLAFPFDPWITSRQPSVYVISDSEMKAYKQKQAAAEVLELKRLIDYHKCQAERLEADVARIEQEYPPTAS